MSGVIAKNRAVENGVFTGTIGTWATNPPISHLGTMQIPIPFAEVDPVGNELEFTFEAQNESDTAESFTFDVFSLLAHDLPIGAEIEVRDGSAVLGSLTVTDQRVKNATLVLSSPATLDTVTVNVSNVTSSTVRIGGLFVGQGFYGDYAAGWKSRNNSASILSRVALTIWGLTRSTGRVIDYVVHDLTEDQAYGTDGGRSMQDLLAEVGNTEPVMVIPSTSSQARIDKLHVYGTLEEGATVYHSEATSFGAQFTVVEMR